MDGYIRREDVIAWFMPYAHVRESIDADVVISDIKGIPSVGVAPVRHGRWVDRIVDENEVIQPWMKRYYCSECLEGGNQSWFKFCPNCGAKMDGGECDEAD